MKVARALSWLCCDQGLAGRWITNGAIAHAHKPFHAPSGGKYRPCHGDARWRMACCENLVASQAVKCRAATLGDRTG